MIYGYCRISSKKQNIERQVVNILREYPNAKLYQEVFTGTKVIGRTQWNNLLKQVKQGDTIVFDSVSRMSRNATDGIELYMELMDKGVNLVFLKEPHINTDTYKQALGNQITLTGDDVDDILIGVNKYLRRLATKQIELAFQQAEKEVTDLQQRTKEGLERAKANGKQVGQAKGSKLTTKKSVAVKERMLEVVKEFGGYCDKEEDILKLLGVSRNTYYKYKRELKQELSDKGDIELK